MLNVANRPLVSYQLEFLEETGFAGATFVAGRGASYCLCALAHVRTKKNFFTFSCALEITIVTSERSHAALSTYLNEGYRGKLKANVSVGRTLRVRFVLRRDAR